MSGNKDDLPHIVVEDHQIAGDALHVNEQRNFLPSLPTPPAGPEEVMRRINASPRYRQLLLDRTIPPTSDPDRGNSRG